MPPKSKKNDSSNISEIIGDDIELDDIVSDDDIDNVIESDYGDDDALENELDSQFDSEVGSDDDIVDDKLCYYKNAVNRDDDDDDDSDVESNIETPDEISNDIDISKLVFVDDDKRITKPFLFRFEKIRLICQRAQQISFGAKPMVHIENKTDKNISSKMIAELELEKKVMPLNIIRGLPNGKNERWNPNELISL
jgi:DNA-directed RNA polymerase subunit K/omega